MRSTSHSQISLLKGHELWEWHVLPNIAVPKSHRTQALLQWQTEWREREKKKRKKERKVCVLNQDDRTKIQTFPSLEISSAISLDFFSSGSFPGLMAADFFLLMLRLTETLQEQIVSICPSSKFGQDWENKFKQIWKSWRGFLAEGHVDFHLLPTLADLGDHGHYGLFFPWFCKKITKIKSRNSIWHKSMPGINDDGKKRNFC